MSEGLADDDKELSERLQAAYVAHPLAGSSLLSSELAKADLVRAELDLDRAYRVQEAVVDGLGAQWSSAVAAYKISMTSAESQAAVGLDEPTLGRLLEPQVLQTGATIDLVRNNFPLLEVELLFRVAEPINAEMSEAAVAQRLEMTTGIEIPTSRFDRWFAPGGPPIVNAEMIVADNSVAAYLVCAADWVPAGSLALDALDATVELDGKIVSQGSTARVMGDPLKAVTWLLAKLSSWGESPSIGAIIASGNCIDLVRPEAGAYRASITGLGSVEAVFV